MAIHKSAVTEEMKTFLKEGLQHYAPACMALSEFRRQVRSRLQSVLDESVSEFKELGLDVANLNPAGEKQDAEDLNETSSWIGLTSGWKPATGSFSCEVEWDLEQPVGKKLWVCFRIYLVKKADRNRLCNALAKERSFESKSDWDSSGGSADLSCYFESDAFYDFDVTFRTLILEYVELLSRVGGIQPFTSGASTQNDDLKA